MSFKWSNQMVMTNELVSILIPVYNAEKWLAATIQSALDQSWKNTEIIIVNDGSTDQSLEIAQSFPSEKVKVINQANAGASAARNRAFKESQGDYIQYLDADDLLASDKIKTQLDQLLIEPDGSIATCSYGLFIDRVIDAKFQPDEGWKNFEQPLDWLILAAQHKARFYTNVWLTPRKIIEEAGGWAEELKDNPIDDAEFFSRVLKAAKKIVFCDKGKAFYRQGKNNRVSAIVNHQANISRLETYKRINALILTYKDTDDTRMACATQLNRMMLKVYPQDIRAYKLALNEKYKLGVNGFKVITSKKITWLNRLLGWKTVKWLRYFYYKMRFAS